MAEHNIPAFLANKLPELVNPFGPRLVNKHEQKIIDILTTQGITELELHSQALLRANAVAYMYFLAENLSQINSGNSKLNVFVKDKEKKLIKKIRNYLEDFFGKAEESGDNKFKKILNGAIEFKSNEIINEIKNYTSSNFFEITADFKKENPGQTIVI